jgi:hypothetical protein
MVQASMQVFEANDIQETRCLTVLKIAFVHSTDISNKKMSISDGMRGQVRSTRPLFTRMIRIIVGADEEGQNLVYLAGSENLARHLSLSEYLMGCKLGGTELHNSSWNNDFELFPSFRDTLSSRGHIREVPMRK